MAKERNKAMAAYVDEIGDKTLLTDEQERALAMKIEKGDQKAVAQLVEANLRFVLSVANLYRGQGADYDDLVGEGNIALLKAATRFSPYPDKRFVKFAAPIIRDAMEKFIEQHSGLYKIPRTEQSAAETRRNHPASIDAPIPVGSKNNFSLLNLLENADAPYADSVFANKNYEEHLLRVMAVLDERERQVVQLIYGIGSDRHTMAEAAQLMGLRRERVRQIRDKALRKLRKMVHSS